VDIHIFIRENLFPDSHSPQHPEGSLDGKV